MNLSKHANRTKSYRNVLTSSIFLVTLSLSTSLYSQQLKFIDSITSSESPTNEKMQIIETFLETEQTNDSIAYLYNQYAYWLYDYDLKKTINFEQKALSTSLQSIIIDTLFIQKSAFNLGYYFQKDNQYLEAIKAYRKVIFTKNNNYNAVKAYDKIGFSFDKIFDYQQAIKNYSLVLSILDNEEQRLNKVRDTHYNIASISLKINTPDALSNGIYHIAAADSLASIIPTDNERLFRIKNCYAELYNQHHTLDTKISYKYYDEAYKIALELNDTSKIRDTYFGKGSLFNTTDQKKSLLYLDKSLELISKEDSLSLYYTINDIGLSHGFAGDYEKSIHYLINSLDYLSETSFDSTIGAGSFALSPYKQELLYAIPLLAKTYLRSYEKTNDTSQLDKSLAYFELADQIIDALKVNSNEFTSRLFWRQISSQLYAIAIRACYLKKDQEKAFYYMEKNKALLFLEDISNKQFKKGLNLPESYHQKEASYLKQARLLDEKINSTIISEAYKSQLQQEQIDLQLSIQSHREEFGIKQNKFARPNMETIASLQKDMEVDEMVIEYNISNDDGHGIYSNNENGYVLCITKEESHLFEIQELTKLKAKLAELVNSMKSPFKTASDADNYASCSSQLFLSLFPSEMIRSKLAGKKLIIVPDQSLSFLPFEALSISEEKTNYLISQNQIRYAYSITFLKSIPDAKSTNHTFLGVAPIDFSNLRLPNLKYSEEELQPLQNYFNGESLRYETATKSAFMKKMGSHSLLHLATHADAQDEETPWIAFSDSKLTLAELYEVKNQATLVILSACNTSLGKQEAGEGVMSLARGFFYGGAQSVISSLWSIDDRSSATLLKDFYKNIDQGDTKSEALHSAKITYLNSHSLSDTSPYYWASFIMLGDNDNIISASYQWWWLLLASIFLLVIFYLVKSRKKRT